MIFPQQIFLQISVSNKFFYFSLLWTFSICEVTYSQHVILVRNVHLATNKDKILIVLYSSEMHGKEVIPQQVKITS